MLGSKSGRISVSVLTVPSVTQLRDSVYTMLMVMRRETSPLTFILTALLPIIRYDMMKTFV